MPESIEAEAAVLGSMIIDPERIGQVIELLKAESFYHFAHQVIFDALVKLYENSTAVDLVLLRDELKKRKQLEEVGGVEYLKKLAESVPSSANIEYYAEYRKRQIASARAYPGQHRDHQRCLFRRRRGR